MFSQATPAQRRTLLAAALGWALDAFDVMLYAMVVAYVMRDLRIDKPTVGLLNTLTLLASGIGGLLFGWIADRVGRTRALMLSIATYSICSFASGLSTSVQMLAACRFVLGLGMGGEWNTGATLVAETWPTHLRAKAIAVVQSSWAWGYAAAALVAGLTLQYSQNWRYVFFVGIAPALLLLWIQKEVPESELWQKQQTNKAPNAKLSSEHVRNAIVLLALNFFGLFAWWGLFTWIPPYLSLPVEQGGRGFSQLGTTGLLVFLNLVGMFPGYISFGFFADRIGRRWSFFLYLFAAACVVPIYAAARQPWQILVMGAVVAFFGTGFFSGSGIVGSELFPTHVRARALGLTYNGARMLSCVAPYVIGSLSMHRGLSGAFVVCAVGFLLAAFTALLLPETRGRELAN
ncbi:major facilitator superfamily (MFS) transporter [Candidatus Koribacter versatilis Ellin345]|uniref:Major facilitator superfamily (MFS) transporter n=1 Tax=Koribacter versatilis (strain Ellin345) TaxID=204669 RepID=Q1INB7_KORVE|nr:MFS transporter [Candidatus Koribacter versatilis]ABF41633.1 major facilitator superfamily (MFS) transporter [Candidatus Koribacter versatilis Ellin345]